MKTYIIILILTLTINVQAQLSVKTNGDVKIGSQLTYPSGGKLEITGNNETLEARIFTTSEDNACLWTINSVYAFGFGIDQSGKGHIYRNINSKSAIMTFCSNGFFGIGRIPAYKLDVDGNIRTNTIIFSSDERIRSNIKPISDKTDDLLKLQSVSFDLDASKIKLFDTTPQTQTMNDNIIINEIEQNNHRLHYGFIAKDVQKIFPELVYEDNNGILGIDYISIIPILIDVLKQQNKTIEDLKKEIEILKLTQESFFSSTIDNSKCGILHQNYPNPFNKSTSINLTLSDNINYAELIIYDLLGNQIKSYSIDKRNDVKMMLDGSDLKSGVYLYSLFADGKLIGTKSMIRTE